MQAWTNNYLRKTLRTAVEHLNDDGHVVLNVFDRLESVVIQAAADEGLVLVDTLRLKVGTDHFRKKQGHADVKTEPVLIFMKV